MKQKITEIYTDKLLTRNERNEYGQWQTVQREFHVRRDVGELSAGLRLVNLMIDTTFYYGVIGYLLSEFSFIWEVPPFGLIYMYSYPLYYILMEYFTQTTVGKIFTNSVVINEFGDKPDFKTIVVRTVIRFIPFEFLSFFYKNRGWHDRWTNTWVVPRKEMKQLKELMADESAIMSN